MHLSFESVLRKHTTGSNLNEFRNGIDIDSVIFYSVPTSFFVIDDRIPRIIRELISEAEGSLKMNYLTGASACARKAIYELTVVEKAQGKDYQEKIKFLKNQYPAVDPDLFDVLAHIQDMTSDKVHEQSWDKWESPNLILILETLKAVLHEIYVLPKEKVSRSIEIQKLKQQISSKGKAAQPSTEATEAG